LFEPACRQTGPCRVISPGGGIGIHAAFRTLWPCALGVRVSPRTPTKHPSGVLLGFGSVSRTREGSGTAQVPVAEILKPRGFNESRLLSGRGEILPPDTKYKVFCGRKKQTTLLFIHLLPIYKVSTLPVMVHSIWGPNIYKQRLITEDIIADAKKKDTKVEVRCFDGDEKDVAYELQSALSERSLFETVKKIFVLRGVEDVEDQKLLAAIVEKTQKDKDNILIARAYWATKEIPKKYSYLQLLENKKKHFCQKPTSSDTKKALLDLTEEGISIDQKALEMVCAVWRGDIEGAVNEVRRLAFLENPITTKTIKKASWQAGNVSYFDLVKTLLWRSTFAQRLSAWERVQALHQDNFGLFGYVAKAASGSSDLIQKIARADRAIKIGRLNPDQALLALLLS